MPVNFHAPNEAAGRLGPPTKVPGGPLTTITQTVKVTLSWNGKPLGKCADLCFKERVVMLPVDGHFPRLNFTIHWRPVGCPAKVTGYPGSDKATMLWDSPNFYDVMWIDWTAEEWEKIQQLPVGTVIAYQKHHYLFDGGKCDGIPWGPLVVGFCAELIIEESKDANGNPIPNPDGGNVKVPAWHTVTCS